MKKLITFIGIVLLCCLLLTSCGTYLPDYITFYKELSPKDTIVWNEEDNGITYNGIKYTVRYEIRNKETGVLNATGETSHCFLSKDGRIVSLKKELPHMHEVLMELVEKKEL